MRVVGQLLVVLGLTVLLSHGPTVDAEQLELGDVPLAPVAAAADEASGCCCIDCRCCDTLEAENARLRARLAKWEEFNVEYQAWKSAAGPRVFADVTANSEFSRPNSTECPGGVCTPGQRAFPDVIPRRLGIFR